MADKFILDGRCAVLEPDLIKWAQWYEAANRRVGDDTVGGTRVSTVFLGMDHNWGDGPPALYETLVFGGSLDGEMGRYSTWEEAEAGHTQMVERVEASR